VPRARQVLIECRERLEAAMAQIAFVRVAVPTCTSGTPCRVVQVRSSWSSEEAGRVGDDVVPVRLPHVAIHLGARNTRDAAARFHVEDERGFGDEPLGTSAHRAGYVSGLVDAGVHVATEVRDALEELPAGNTVQIVMEGRLAIVFVEAVLVLEELVALAAPDMDVIVVVFVLAPVGEVLVAVLAVVVLRVLYPVFLEPDPAHEVQVAVLAPVVRRGRTQVAVVRLPAAE